MKDTEKEVCVCVCVLLWKHLFVELGKLIEVLEEKTVDWKDGSLTKQYLTVS